MAHDRELLEALAHELRLELTKVAAQLSAEELEHISAALISRGARAWGNKFPAAPGVAVDDLRYADAVYAELHSTWAPVIAQLDQPEQWCAVVVNRLLGVTRDLLGGMYVAKGAPDRVERDRQICNKFRGRGSYRELAIEYNLTEQRIRQIVEAGISAERDRRQLPLFPE